MSLIPLGDVHEVVLKSFQLNEFRRLLKHKLEIDLEEVVGNIGFSEAVERVLDHVDDRGLLPVLLVVMAKERPLRQDVQDLYRKFASQVVGRLGHQQMSAAVTDAYAKFFGHAPGVAWCSQATVVMSLYRQMMSALNGRSRNRLVSSITGPGQDFLIENGSSRLPS